ncbi:hypothetical protein SFC79_13645 [Nocardioides sp. S-58]|uniref:MFS transporter n=1 Tax=Nocardioides renjunii TaxID=3095075 RepID=A0ABU5KD72_9ACTN|nr:hypothetical protein [Nocardioides sp. S-58]MDZ5662813.1 hypothetical protein [Nocardioides sp. S-58]
MTFEARVVQARAPHALARAAAATAVAVTGAAAAHTWAGGEVPTGPGLVLVAAVVLAGGWLVLGRDVPAWAMLPVVAAAQLGLHESFGLVAGHDHHAAAVPDPGWTWQMVAAHASVTLATAVLWWAGRRAASYVVTLLAHASLPVTPRLRRRPADAPAGTTLVHLLVSPRRGPPLAVLPT